MGEGDGGAKPKKPKTSVEPKLLRTPAERAAPDSRTSPPSALVCQFVLGRRRRDGRWVPRGAIGHGSTCGCGGIAVGAHRVITSPETPALSKSVRESLRPLAERAAPDSRRTPP
eukprot:SAG11_NODE_2232_length_3656_cov_3.028957_5_plen_114_part_00